MDLKIVKNSTKHIPTRFDDIQKEIMQERIQNAIKAYKKYVTSPQEVNFYKLGDVLGEKLDKIV